MIIRKAELSDINELVKLRISFMKEVNGVTNSEDQEKYEALTKANSEYFSTHIPDHSFIAWLAVENDKIVGTSGLIFYNRPPSYKNISGKTAYIMNIYTLKEHRNQGIAGILLQKVIDEAVGRGYHNICLNATDMGKPLYLKHNFKEVNGEMVLNV